MIEYNYHLLEYRKLQFKYSTLFFTRNIKQNALVKLNGIFENTKSKLPKFLYKVEYVYNVTKYFLRSSFGKLDLPQIEFVISTDCNLQCQHCNNYTPLIFTKENYDFEEYKKDLDNLLKRVNSIQYLSISGGEPFLNKDLDKYIEYTVSKSKIKNVIVLTNGTLLPNNRVIKAMKKNRKKFKLYISNYLMTPLIDKTVLRTNKLINLCLENKIKYIFEENLKWHYTTDCKRNNRSEKELKDIYLKCLNPNLSCFKGIISPCSRSTSIKLLDLFDIPKEQYIDLKDKNLTKKDLVDWYSDIKPFIACDFCNYIDIESRSKYIIPGSQTIENKYW